MPESKKRNTLKKRNKVIAATLLLFHVMGLLSSVHAILNVRTPQGTIAWVVSLNAFPVAAVPAYWVLGRSQFNDNARNLRNSALEIHENLNKLSQDMRPYFVEAPETLPEYEAVKSLARHPFTRANKVELLVDGKATFNSIEAGIEKAKSYILFQFYILRNDGTGNRFKQQLIRKAKNGVSVYVLYDELGSSELTPEWQADFSAANIKILPFNTRQGKGNRFQLNFRNHRKLVVVDGEATWIGGLNMGDDYIGLNERLTPWRDTHIHIQGPAALSAQISFLSDWYWASNELLSDLFWEPKPHDNSDQNVLILASGPADAVETASLFFTNTLNIARERIWIATPYFIPDEATMVALRLALLKGIDVRIITPELNDNWFVHHAANVYLSELSALGAKIYFFQKGFMHQKTMLIDNHMAIVGTANFDNRSFRLNFEITGAIADKTFAAELEHMLLDDLNNSKQAKDYHLQNASLWEQIKARGSSLLAPVL